ncbi:MAG: ERCC4 domain-containing protein [Oscillospiraceae bacterium]
MTILVDTREKMNAHILEYFDKKKIPYIIKALGQADYSFYIPANTELSIPRDLYFNGEIVIERKGSLEELSTNLSTQRDRFEKELSTCRGKKILLIENANYSDVVSGNYNTQYNKKSFWGTLHSFWFKYDLPFVFMPDNRYSAPFIYGTFQYYFKNYLR